MNAPDFYEMFTLPEGVKKVAVHRDAKQLDTATIEIQKEDHTLGNLISKKLLKDNRVTFSGYKFPHPLEHKILIRVQTTEEITPVVAVHDAIGGLISELQDIAGKFKLDIVRVGAEQDARQSSDTIGQGVDSKVNYPKDSDADSSIPVNFDVDF